MIEGEVVKPEENAKATGVKNPCLNPSSQASVPKSQEAEHPCFASSSQALGPQTSRASPADMQDTSVTTGNWMDRYLDEDDFYKEVNKDLESRLEDIDPDEDRMADLVIVALNNHVAEIYSPPRINAFTKKYGLAPGFALDILVNDEYGNPWDSNDEKQRAKCRQMIIEEKPSLPIGSPMCTILNALQNLNRPKMGEAKWKIAWDHGMKHLLFAFEMYEIQVKAGRYFLHEHPNSATSWHLPEIVQFMSK